MSTAVSPETVETALGPVEVERRGAGDPVIFIHGTPGGSDSSVAMVHSEAGQAQAQVVEHLRAG